MLDCSSSEPEPEPGGIAPGTYQRSLQIFWDLGEHFIRSSDGV